MKIMSEKQYIKKKEEIFENGKQFGYAAGKQAGYHDALMRIKAEIQEDINQRIAEVSAILKEAFTVNIVEETVNSGRPLSIENTSELYTIIRVELPTIMFRVEIKPVMPYFCYLKGTQ